MARDARIQQREWFDLTDPDDLERFDEAVIELERQKAAAEADNTTETAVQ